MTTAVVGRPIAAADERDIIGRWLAGQDPLRIAADTGRKRDKVAELIGRISGFDRGRANQACRAWDAAARKAGTAPRDDLPALQDENARLRQKLTEALSKLDESRKRLALTRKELASRPAAGPQPDPRVAELEQQLAERQARLDAVHELISWARPGNGASILVDRVREALEPEEPQP